MIDQRVRGIVIETLYKVRPKLASQLQDLNIDLPIADLEMDSLDAIEWCMEIEARTGIELDPAELVTAGSIGELVSLIANRHRRPQAPIEPPMVRAPRDKPVPLSLVQESIWKHCRAPNDSTAYVLCMKDQIVGPLDVAALRDCLSEIVRRHEIVRTTFTVFDGQPVQTIHPAEPIELPLFDVASEANPKQVAERIVKTEWSRISDLAHGPLTRFLLVRIRENEHWLLRICHHILWDGWSSKVLLKELAQLYGAKFDGVALPLRETEPLQYADYAVWQRKVLDPEGSTYREMVAWWRECFRQLPPLPDLPFRRPTPLADIDPADGIFRLPVDPQLAERIGRLRRAEEATLYQIWLAAFVALLALEMKCLDVVIGTYATVRRRAEVQNMMGNFAHTIVLRFRCDYDTPFRNWLSQVRDGVTASEARCEIPYEELCEELQRSGVAMPEIRAIFSAPLGYGPSDLHFSDLRITRHGALQSTAMPWGFQFWLDERNGCYECVTNFDAGLYDPLRVRAFVRRLHELLNMISCHPDLSIGELRALHVDVAAPEHYVLL